MKLTRYIKPPQVKMELETENLPEIPEGWSRERYIWTIKESVLKELITLFINSGKVANSKKLYIDLLNREKKATTAIGKGIAIPHVRTMQAKDFIIAFARSSKGLEFEAVDKQPVHVFFSIVAPPYDDRLYLRVYRRIGLIFKSENAINLFRSARNEHEVIKIISDLDSLSKD